MPCLGSAGFHSLNIEVFGNIRCALSLRCKPPDHHQNLILPGFYYQLSHVLRGAEHGMGPRSSSPSPCYLHFLRNLCPRLVTVLVNNPADLGF